ncbi:hypothetical protein [Sphingomonas baiyangensis]|uniref:Secreted protein n=1 Tax=Sphingomonas baiyangensis TaxID=2572576 RepID=A0A4U1L0K7_9SPHN|nr:hypothetical protein [Sphingomonas baiyangensis]TKD50132.1 hypothetical protein FBR43_04690 [Sphingomonas baiyangensis]
MPHPLPLSLLACMALAMPSLAVAQDDPPKRLRNVQVMGNEPCPEAAPDEILVCGRIDPEEQFRIPKQFREPPPSPANTAWAVRAERMMDDNRIGLPDSCSPVGTGGQTGCAAMFNNNWRAMAREQRRLDAQVP